MGRKGAFPDIRIVRDIWVSKAFSSTVIQHLPPLVHMLAHTNQRQLQLR